MIERERLWESVGAVGSELKRALTARRARCPSIGDVRGHGLFIGIEMVKGDEKAADVEQAVAVVNRLKDKGFLMSNAGVFRNVVKIRPPLVFKQEHAEAFLAAFDETISELHL